MYQASFLIVFSFDLCFGISILANQVSYIRQFFKIGSLFGCCCLQIVQNFSLWLKLIQFHIVSKYFSAIKMAIWGPIGLVFQIQLPFSYKNSVNELLFTHGATIKLHFFEMAG